MNEEIFTQACNETVDAPGLSALEYYSRVAHRYHELMREKEQRSFKEEWDEFVEELSN